MLQGVTVFWGTTLKGHRGHRMRMSWILLAMSWDKAPSASSAPMFETRAAKRSKRSSLHRLTACCQHVRKFIVNPLWFEYHWSSCNTWHIHPGQIIYERYLQRWHDTRHDLVLALPAHPKTKVDLKRWLQSRHICKRVLASLSGVIPFCACESPASTPDCLASQRAGCQRIKLGIEANVIQAQLNLVGRWLDHLSLVHWNAMRFYSILFAFLEIAYPTWSNLSPSLREVERKRLQHPKTLAA